MHVITAFTHFAHFNSLYGYYKLQFLCASVVLIALWDNKRSVPSVALRTFEKCFKVSNLFEGIQITDKVICHDPLLPLCYQVHWFALYLSWTMIEQIRTKPMEHYCTATVAWPVATMLCYHFASESSWSKDPMGCSFQGFDWSPKIL